MKTDHDCGCRTSRKPYDTADSKKGAFVNGGQSACDKFMDPAWIKILVDYFPAGFEARNGEFTHIPPAQAYELLQAHDDWVILDVKTKEEYLEKHLPGAVLLDFFSASFKDDLFGLDKDKCYVVICKIGVRSGITMNLMKKMGFRQVFNVVGGDDRWIDEEIPYHQWPSAVPC